MLDVGGLDCRGCWQAMKGPCHPKMTHAALFLLSTQTVGLPVPGSRVGKHSVGHG